MLRVGLTAVNGAPSAVVEQGGRQCNSKGEQMQSTPLALALSLEKGRQAFIPIDSTNGQAIAYSSVILDGLEGESLFGCAIITVELHQVHSTATTSILAHGQTDVGVPPYETDEARVLLYRCASTRSNNFQSYNVPSYTANSFVLSLTLSAEAVRQPAPLVDVCVDEISHSAIKRYSSSSSPSSTSSSSSTHVFCNGFYLGVVGSLPLIFHALSLDESNAVSIALGSADVLSCSLDDLEPLSFVHLRGQHASAWARLLSIPSYTSSEQPQLDRVDLHLALETAVELPDAPTKLLTIASISSTSDEQTPKEIMPLALTMTSASKPLPAMISIPSEQEGHRLHFSLENHDGQLYATAECSKFRIGEGGIWSHWNHLPFLRWQDEGHEVIGWMQMRATRFRRACCAPATMSNDPNIASAGISAMAEAVLQMQRALARGLGTSLVRGEETEETEETREEEEESYPPMPDHKDFAAQEGRPEIALDAESECLEEEHEETYESQRKREDALEQQMKKLSDAPQRANEAYRKLKELKEANMTLRHKHKRVARQANVARGLMKQAREQQEAIERYQQQLSSHFAHQLAP